MPQQSVWQTPVDQGVTLPLEYWTEVLGRNLFGATIHPLHADRFQGRLEMRSYGAASMVRVDVSAQRFHRTPAAIATDGCDDVILNLMLGGRLRLRQMGREELFRPGDCFLSDCGKPFDYRSPDTIHALTLRIPRVVLKRHLPDIEGSVAQRIDGDSRWGTALRTYLQALADDGTPNVFPPAMLVDQAISLIRIALGPKPESCSSHQAATLSRVRAIMSQRWNEEGLSPFDVSTTAGISRSHLHGLFAKEGTTFGRELEIIRMDQAAALLGPTGRRLTIDEIAFRCGFASAAHFSRKFKLARGASPSDYRRRVMD